MLLHKTVIVEKETEKQNGIIDPTKKSQVGIIREIGTGLEFGKESFDIGIGDRVVYYENSLLEIEYDGKKEYVLDFDDIIKIIPPLDKQNS